MKAYVKEALLLTSRKLYEVRIVREKGVDLDTSYDEYTFGVYEDSNTAIAVAEGHGQMGEQASDISNNKF